VSRGFDSYTAGSIEGRREVSCGGFKWSAAEAFAIEPQVVVGHALKRIAFKVAAPGGLAESGQAIGMPGNLEDGNGESGRVARGHDESGTAGFQDLRHAPDVGNHDRKANGQGLQKRNGKTFGNRREHEQVSLNEPIANVVAHPQQLHGTGESETADQGFERGPLGAIAKDPKPYVGERGRDDRERLKQGRKVFFGREAADANERESGGAGGPGGWHGGARRSGAVGDKYELPARGSGYGGEFAKSSLRDRHHPLAQAGDEPKLSFNVAAVPKATVTGGDDAGNTGQPGSRDPDESGANVVTVKDVRSVRAEGPGHTQESSPGAGNFVRKDGNTGLPDRVSQSPGGGESVHSEADAPCLVDLGEPQQKPFCAADLEAVDQMVDNQPFVHAGGTSIPRPATHQSNTSDSLPLT